MRNVLILLGAAGAVLLAGCGSDANTTTPAASSSPAPTTSGPASSSGALSSGASSSSASSGASSAALQSALLTADEVGTGFTVLPENQDTDSPLPCTPSAKPLFDQFPAAQKAERNYANSGATLQIGETVATFDANGAKQIFAAAVKGFSCTSGALGGGRVAITKRSGGQQSTADTESAAWDFTDGKQLGTAAVIRVGDKFAAMSFGATKSAANDINVNEILQKAATKVAALP